MAHIALAGGGRMDLIKSVLKAFVPQKKAESNDALAQAQFMLAAQKHNASQDVNSPKDGA